MTETERGLVGLGNKLIGSLPAQFLLLALMNVIFICGLLWFLNNRDDARERLLTPLLADCIRQRQ